MGVDEFNQEDLKKIYRRGRRTVNRIAGQSIEHKVEDKERGIRRPPTLEELQERYSDEDIFNGVAIIPFYAGMKAIIVDSHRPAIIKWLGDYKKVMKYSDKEFNEMLADEDMFKNKKKIKAAMKNAGEFNKIAEDVGFLKYLFGFEPYDNEENLSNLIEDFANRFQNYAFTTTVHLLMSLDIGLPLIKPDQHMMLTFYRIGLVDKDKDTMGTFEAAAVVADAAEVPMDWVDCFVSLGLKGFYYPGSEVCGKKPKCNRKRNPCEIRELCKQWNKDQEKKS